MSLINQMLKDLEKRSRPPINPEITLTGLLANELAEKKKKNLPLIIGILFVLSVLLVIFFHNHLFHKKNKSSSLAQNISANNNLNTTIPNTGLQDNTPMQNVDITPSILTGITLQTQQEITSLRFLLNQETFYVINKDEKKNILQIILENTNLVADLPPIDYLKTAIKNLEISNDSQGNLVITLALNSGAEIQHLDISQEQSPELQLDIFMKKMPEPAPALTEEKTEATKTESFIKKPVEEFNVEQQYKNAYNFSLMGQKDKAVMMLTMLLEAHPVFHPARELLINLLLEQGNLVKAEKILQAGLSFDSNYSPFVELKAKMLVNAGKVNKALELLQRAAPPIENNPDYHAFIAALYQRQGQSLLAAKLYEQLLSVEPNKAIWWMGLAIALESQGNESEAREAYMHANNGAGLNPELRAFVQTKINSI